MTASSSTLRCSSSKVARELLKPTSGQLPKSTVLQTTLRHPLQNCVGTWLDTAADMKQLAQLDAQLMARMWHLVSAGFLGMTAAAACAALFARFGAWNEVNSGQKQMGDVSALSPSSCCTG